MEIPEIYRKYIDEKGKGAINQETNLHETALMAQKNKQYSCPHCKETVIFSDGKIKGKYFSHLHCNGCIYYNKPSKTQQNSDCCREQYSPKVEEYLSKAERLIRDEAILWYNEKYLPEYAEWEQKQKLIERQKNNKKYTQKYKNPVECEIDRYEPMCVEYLKNNPKKPNGTMFRCGCCKLGIGYVKNGSFIKYKN